MNDAKLEERALLSPPFDHRRGGLPGLHVLPLIDPRVEQRPLLRAVMGDQFRNASRFQVGSSPTTT